MTLLIGCSKDAPVEKLNTTEVSLLFANCVSDKNVLQTQFDTLNVDYTITKDNNTKLKLEYIKLKNITLTNMTQLNLCDTKLIQRNKYLKELAKDCHFVNQTDREEELEDELEECEDTLDKIWDIKDE